MDTKFITRMRDSLVRLKHELLQRLAEDDAEFRETFDDLDPKDAGDIAAEDIDRTTLQVLSAQEVKRLNLIDSALSRLENGRYGVCMRCGGKIPEARLEAIPYALLCVTCQSDEERRNR